MEYWLVNNLDEIKKAHEGTRLVYKSCEQWLVVLAPTENTRTNEERDGIVNRWTAKFRGSEFMVVAIVNKYTPDRMTTVVSNTYYADKTIEYEVGKLVRAEDYDPDLNNVCAAGIHFYLSAAPAFYLEDSRDTGITKQFHENGQIAVHINLDTNELTHWLENGEISLIHRIKPDMSGRTWSCYTRKDDIPCMMFVDMSEETIRIFVIQNGKLTTKMVAEHTEGKLVKLMRWVYYEEDQEDLPTFEISRTFEPCSSAQYYYVSTEYSGAVIKDGDFEAIIDICMSDKYFSNMKTLAFHPNGQLAVIAHYTGQKLHGAYRSFGADGRMTKSCAYNKGELHGPCIVQEDGILKEIGEYVNGKKTGTWSTYENGSCTMRADYSRGKFHGEYRQWTDGKLTMMGRHAHDKKDGKWIYFEDGLVVSAGSYEVQRHEIHNPSSTGGRYGGYGGYGGYGHSLNYYCNNILRYIPSTTITYSSEKIGKWYTWNEDRECSIVDYSAEPDSDSDDALDMNTIINFYKHMAQNDSYGGGYIYNIH